MDTKLKKLHPRLQSVVARLNEQLRASDITLYPKEKPVSVNAQGKEVYPVIIRTNNPSVTGKYNITRNTALGNFVTARVTADELVLLANDEQISYIYSGEILYPFNDMASALTGADLVKAGFVNNTAYKGSGVLICIIDTGIDWAHLDFRDPADTTLSRIEYIWDQTITPTGGESNPSGFNYGVEYTKNNIQNEIDGSPAGFVRENDINGHGTHVAGTAAGNGASLSGRKYEGIAPETKIIIVKAGNSSFPTANIIDALTYAKNKSISLGLPMVVNLSLGGHNNGHDGLRDMDVAVDSFCGSGRVAVIAAGNDGGNAIHISGTLPSSSSATVQFSVPSYSANSGSSNDYFAMDLYFDSSLSASATVTTPNGYTATQNAGTYATTQTNDGGIFLYNDIDASNGDREIYLEVYDVNASFPPVNGTWTLTLNNNTGTSHPFHAWLFATSMGATLTGGNSNYTVASPGTATRAITVGSYVSRWRWYGNDGGSYSGVGTDYSDNISSFSSIGPRRDNVQKPDVAAPGEKIISAISTASTPSTNSVVPGGKHYRNQGTSMASPVVTGLAALLLCYNNSFTYSDVKDYLRNNAETDSYTGSVPNYTWGYGKANIFKALTKAISSGASSARKMFAYDSWSSSSSLSAGANVKLAVKFSPDISGTVSNLFFHLHTGHNITSSVTGEVWSDASGLPSSQLGSSGSIANNLLLGHSWNTIPMQNSGVTVTAGTDYHAVIYFTSGSSTAFATDNGSVDNRSSYNTGSGWTSYGSADLRIRALVTVNNGALPVELVSFTGYATQNGIKLSWRTETEKNNFGFTLQKKYSPSGEWADVSFIRGKGTTNTPNEYAYFDADIPFSASAVIYRLKQQDMNGSFTYSSEQTVTLSVPVNSYLGYNYPNPFNPRTVIPFTLAGDSYISLVVYDMLGKKVHTLIENTFLPAGNHSAIIEGKALAAGNYFVRLNAGGKMYVRKITLIK